MDIVKRFIDYCKIDTQSDEESTLTPSTSKQLILAEKLLKELKDLGIDNAELTKEGVVYAHIDGDSSLDSIGLIAHMDTAPDFIGGNFEPRIVKNYDGSVIKLNEQENLDPKRFPHLKRSIGHDLVVTDGNHLLGGDDKAGIAIIMDLAEYYTSHPEIKHAPIRICFTPDEEIGRGPENFDVKKMGAKIAYTVDGGAYEYYSYENFNAYSVKVHIQGVSIHPGSAKGIMVNSILVANEFISSLPSDMVPSKTSGYEGFNHCVGISGDTAYTDMAFIVRNHDNDKANEQIAEFYKIGRRLQEKYPTAKIDVESKLTYRNMKDYFVKDMSAIDRLVKAFKLRGVTPIAEPIRGGTDGATITYMGLPCPNIGNGDYNCHGKYEYVDIFEMKEMVEVIKTLLEN